MHQQSYNTSKIIAIVLFILNELKSCDKYLLLKILYFAQQKHLLNYGRPLLNDKFHALDYGPVPTKVYDEIKHLLNKEKYNGESIFLDNVTHVDKNTLVPVKEPDFNFLSESNIKSLLESIYENNKLTFDELYEKSHDEIWKVHYPNGVISEIEMAKAAGANQEMVDYIAQLEESRRFSC